MAKRKIRKVWRHQSFLISPFDSILMVFFVNWILTYKELIKFCGNVLNIWKQEKRFSFIWVVGAKISTKLEFRENHCTRTFPESPVANLAYWRWPRLEILQIGQRPGTGRTGSWKVTALIFHSEGKFGLSWQGIDNCENVRSTIRMSQFWFQETPTIWKSLNFC